MFFYKRTLIVFLSLFGCAAQAMELADFEKSSWLVDELVPVTRDQLCAGYKNDQQRLRSLQILASILVQQKELMRLLAENVQGDFGHTVGIAQISPAHVHKDAMGYVFCAELPIEQYCIALYLASMVDKTKMREMSSLLIGRTEGAFRDALWWQLCLHFEKIRDESLMNMGRMILALSQHAESIAKFSRPGLLRGYCYPYAAYHQLFVHFNGSTDPLDIAYVLCDGNYQKFQKNKALIARDYAGKCAQIDALYHDIIHLVCDLAKDATQRALYTTNWFTKGVLPEVPALSADGSTSLEPTMLVSTIKKHKKQAKTKKVTRKKEVEPVVSETTVVNETVIAEESSITEASAQESTQTCSAADEDMGVDRLMAAITTRAKEQRITVSIDPGHGRYFDQRTLKWFDDSLIQTETAEDVVKHRLPLIIERQFEHLAVLATCRNSRGRVGPCLQFPGAIERAGERTIYGVFVIAIASDNRTIYHRYLQQTSQTDLQNAVRQGQFDLEFPPLTSSEQASSSVVVIGDQQYRVSENELMVRITDSGDVTYVLFKTMCAPTHPTI